MHVTVKDHIYEYTLTNINNELYCYSNEFHSHLPFDRLWIERSGHWATYTLRDSALLRVSRNLAMNLETTPRVVGAIDNIAHQNKIVCGTQH